MQIGQREASKLDIQSIVTELKKERERLSNAITALEGSSAKSAPSITSIHQKTEGNNNHHGSRLSAAGRKRLSELMKKRWAERRRKASEKRS
jgi:hypothetical protein